MPATDAGSILDGLLARYAGYASNRSATSLYHAHRRAGSTPRVAPPAKVVEAVGRGVNPLMLGVDAHRAECAAREKAKQRRMSIVGTGRRTKRRAPRDAVAARNVTPRKDNQGTAKPTTATATRTFSLLSSSFLEEKAALRAREQVTSATQEYRRCELRARQAEEDSKRKRGLTARDDASISTRSLPLSTSSVVAAVSGVQLEGASAPWKRSRVETSEQQQQQSHIPSGARHASTGHRGKMRTRRDIWRRRCSTKKTCRLFRGVSRAAALRRYWYTGLTGEAKSITRKETQTSNTCADLPQSCQRGRKDLRRQRTTLANEERALSCERSRTLDTSDSVLAVRDLRERRCTLRRLRAARRSRRTLTASYGDKSQSHAVAEEYHARPNSQTSTDCPAGVGLPTLSPSAHQVPRQRVGRHQRKRLLHAILSLASARMWYLAVRVVVERLEIVRRLCEECAAANRELKRKASALPLILSRMFPLFGALVDVQELELLERRRRCRSTRHNRRSCAGFCADNHNPSDGPVLRVLQRRSGIVMEEYCDTLGVLLLPQAEEPEEGRAWATLVEMELARRQNGGRASEPVSSSAMPPPHLGSPSVVRVPKHFPGSSGSFAELLQRMLRNSRTEPAAPSTAGKKRSPVIPITYTRVLVAVFRGEVQPVCPPPRGDEERRICTGEPLNGLTDTYPLQRLWDRCF